MSNKIFEIYPHNFNKDKLKIEFKDSNPQEFMESMGKWRRSYKVGEYGNYLKEQIGTTADFDEKNFTEYDKQQLEKTRKSKIIWMKDKWIYREIQPVVHQVNSAAGWNYDWELTEPLQYTKYEGSQKQHYDWHTDSGTNIDENGHIRKISASLMLVDDDKYEGGDFQVCIPKPNGNKIINIKKYFIKYNKTFFKIILYYF